MTYNHTNTALENTFQSLFDEIHSTFFDQEERGRHFRTRLRFNLNRSPRSHPLYAPVRFPSLLYYQLFLFHVLSTSIALSLSLFKDRTNSSLNITITFMIILVDLYSNQLLTYFAYCKGHYYSPTLHPSNHWNLHNQKFATLATLFFSQIWAQNVNPIVVSQSTNTLLLLLLLLLSPLLGLWRCSSVRNIWTKFNFYHCMGQ